MRLSLSLGALCLALALLPCPPRSRAQESPVLATIAENAAGILTLTSDFVQEKHLSIFDEVLRSRGHIHFQREDRLRWEILDPVRTGFVLNGRGGKRWHERTGEEQTFSIERDPIMKIVAGEFLAWVRADFEQIRKNYGIRVAAEHPTVLELTPREEFARFVEQIHITFDPDNRYVQTVELTAADGDTTAIRFENTRVNVPLDAELFAF